MRPAVLPSPVSATSIRVLRRSVETRLCIPASSRRVPSAGRQARRPGGWLPYLVGVVGSDRNWHRWRGSIFIEIGQPQPSDFIARHRLPRQYAGRAGLRQHWRREPYAPLLSSAQPCDPSICLARKRDSDPRQFVAALRPSWRRNSASGGRGGVHREPVMGATWRCVPAGGVSRRPRDLRSRAHPRRGDVRHGPHRHAPRLGAGRHARHPDVAKGLAAVISR